MPKSKKKFIEDQISTSQVRAIAVKSQKSTPPSDEKQGQNIFKYKRNREIGNSVDHVHSKNTLEAFDKQFEKECFKNINEEDWEHLETISVQQLDATKGKSPLGFFYLGVSLYKMNYFEDA